MIATEHADVILRDGRTLRLRPPSRDDADALLAFFGALSQRSLYLRFHGFPQLGPRLVESLLEPDWQERGVLLGALVDEDGERVVAVANYVRLRDPKLAEAAFAVADEHQGARHRHPSARAARARARPRSGSSASSPRCWRTTGRCSASSRRRASS